MKPSLFLLATAGGADVESARQAAADLAIRTGAPLHVVLAWEMRHLPGELAPVFHAADAGARLDAEREQLGRLGATVTDTHLVHGRTSHHVLAMADHLGASLIITGSHHHGRFRRAFHNSVVEATMSHTDVPMLVVPSLEAAWPPRQIVVAHAGPDDSVRSVIEAAWLARTLSLPVVVVRVAPTGSEPDGGSSLAGAVKELEELGVRSIDIQIASGDPATEIVRAAGDVPSLVMVGRRRLGRARITAPDRVSTRVLHRHAGPCLIVPRPVPVPKRHAASRMAVAG